MGKLTLSGCADACREFAENFAFGTNEYGKKRCDGDSCDCYCEFGTENYKCKNIKMNYGFDLYAFKGECIPITY